MLRENHRELWFWGGIVVALTLFTIITQAQDAASKAEAYNFDADMLVIDEMAERHVVGSGEYGIILFWEPLHWDPDEDGEYERYEGFVHYTATVIEANIMGRTRTANVATGEDRALTYYLQEPGCVVHSYTAHSDDGDTTVSEPQTVCIDSQHIVSVRQAPEPPEWAQEPEND